MDYSFFGYLLFYSPILKKKSAIILKSMVKLNKNNNIINNKTK